MVLSNVPNRVHDLSKKREKGWEKMTFDVYVCDMCEKEFAVKSDEEARLCPYCGYHNFEFSHKIKEKQSFETDR